MRLKMVLSHRCFFPYGAFLFSTKQVAAIAEKIGYQGVEFLPTWRFVWEIARYGKILAEGEMIHSGHRDWRFDRVMNFKLGDKSFLSATFGEPADFLFPPSFLCRWALKIFQKRYQAPISTTWFADLPNFAPVMLELWGKRQGVGDYHQLEQWLKEDSRGHGVVLDTYKLRGFLGSLGLEKKEEQIIKELLPSIKEVHFRPGRGKEELEDVAGGKAETDSVQLVRKVVAAGYRGAVVVEFGWPEAGVVLQPTLKNLEEFIEFHQRLLTFVADLSHQ